MDFVNVRGMSTSEAAFNEAKQTDATFLIFVTRKRWSLKEMTVLRQIIWFYQLFLRLSFPLNFLISMSPS